MTTSTVTPEIADFARGVRAALADLPADEVDDLTEGLEADLAEAYAEDLHRELPDPAAYASELRTAAGLPERADSARRSLLSGLSDGWSDTRRDIAITLRRHPPVAGALDFLGTLRPLWWVVRAWLATWLISAFFGMERGYGFDGAWWLVLLGFVVVSVQWGRGHWLRPGVPVVISVGNVVAVVALLPALAAAGAYGDDYSDGYEDAVMESSLADERQGLSMNGRPLENVYAYDSTGRPLRNVQLFDVNGEPLVTARDGDETETVPEPVSLETGAEAYNVFPLELRRMVWDDEGNRVPDPSPDPDKTEAFENGPFVKVPAVQGRGKGLERGR